MTVSIGGGDVRRFAPMIFRAPRLSSRHNAKRQSKGAPVMSTIEIQSALSGTADSRRIQRLVLRNAPVALGLALLAAPGFAAFYRDFASLAAGPLGAVALIGMIGRGLSTLFLMTAAALTVLSLVPRRETRGWRSTLSALGGSFLLIGFVLLPPCPLPAWLELVAAALIAVGNLAATLALFRLGRSFSILPAARRLIDDGPYAVVRHPLYLAEELAVIGLFLHHAGFAAAALAIVHFLLQLDRMRHEERVLTAAFPAYAAYAARTARLLPGIF